MTCAKNPGLDFVRVDTNTMGGTIWSMDQPKCPCYFQLPIRYNPELPGQPGREVEPEVLTEIYKSLDRQFGGYTIHGVMLGSWRGQEEPSIRMCVAVAEEEIPTLRLVVKSIGKKLGQEQMYFERGQPTVELINIDQGTCDLQKEISREHHHQSDCAP